MPRESKIPASAPSADPAGPGPALGSPVQALRGVGTERVRLLEKLGIRTIGDLLLHRPRRYEDRRHFRRISELTRDEPATARGRIVAQGLKRFRGGNRSVFEFILEDGSGRLHCRWWNLPFMERYFSVGDEVFVYGRLVEMKPRTMDHPESEVIEGGEEGSVHVNRIAPIYPLTEGLPQRWLRGLIWRALEKCEPEIAEPGPGRLPPELLRRFPSRANALRMIHFPEEMSDVEIARQRLALDELVGLQAQIQTRRQKFQANVEALPCGGDNRLIRPFLARLGFRLTDAQTRVLREIRADLRGPHPMRRLLQGDVGSGKTLVAACSALMALESGFNVALMAPTEILAGQHYLNFRQWFGPLDVAVELQTGSRRAAVPSGTASGPQAHRALFIGTHALIQSGFEIPRLGLVVIDEQHKFGVAQRERLVRKGQYPHVLVMTATPIPRTLGLTLYGDLDVSVIDAAPAGRGRIKTFIRDAGKLPMVWKFVGDQLAAGRQAYVVCVRVEETDQGEVSAVTREFEQLKTRLAPFRVGLLHGALRSEDKERTMALFRSGGLNVLVATSLVEVGVDVPNATVMLIENAERFGLAQLHQLRGRIGRGAAESFCILISEAKDARARERLEVLASTTDGFKIAEADLKLRGPGELLGRDQSGVPDFRFADLAGDLELIQLARRLVAA